MKQKVLGVNYGDRVQLRETPDDGSKVRTTIMVTMIVNVRINLKLYLNKIVPQRFGRALRSNFDAEGV